LVAERDGLPEAYVIDAEDVRVARRLTRRARVGDLARLAAGLDAHPWVTRSILCRFLRAYVREHGPGAVAWKPLWRAVRRAARRKSKHKRRRGHRVL
jgi:hypothetical protein